MEKEIEIIKSLINDLKREEKLIGYNAEVEIKTLENLIKGYRKLEMENQSYKDYLGYPPCYDNAKYIPKSKIKEKIEELEKEEEGLRNSISAEQYAEYSDANISFELMHIDIQRSILQELMEDK